jgi:FMN phosphatase YigB (HAD superfamily)
VHATGTSVGVVANLWTPALAAVRAGCPALAAGVDGWFASCEQGHVQPGAALLTAALTAFDVKPANALLVGGDVTQQLVPAVALGMSAVWLRPDDAQGGVVPVDPHGAPLPVPADVVPEGAAVARSLSEVRRIALTWLWAARGGRAGLTAPLAV